MKKLLLTLTLIAAAAGAQAQWYVRGDFNSWGTSTPMTDDGDGTFSATVTGGTPGAVIEWKIATSDWTSNYPADNVKSVYDSSGSTTFHFRPGSVSDGWNPTADRVGYSDPGHGWEVMGAFNGWSTPLSLTSAGSGLFTGSYTVATAGTYEFKFRKEGDWSINIGQDFRKDGPNASFTTTAANELVQFSLDLPNGRWQATVVPEPGTFALGALGGIALLAFRRKS